LNCTFLACEQSEETLRDVKIKTVLSWLKAYPFNKDWVKFGELFSPIYPFLEVVLLGNMLTLDVTELARARKGSGEEENLPATNDWELDAMRDGRRLKERKPLTEQARHSCHHSKEFSCSCNSQKVPWSSDKEGRGCRVTFATLLPIEGSTVCCKGQKCLQAFLPFTLTYLRTEFWKQSGQ
jgi:hypothetical protein